MWRTEDETKKTLTRYDGEAKQAKWDNVEGKVEGSIEAKWKRQHKSDTVSTKCCCQDDIKPTLGKHWTTVYRFQDEPKA